MENIHNIYLRVASLIKRVPEEKSVSLCLLNLQRCFLNLYHFRYIFNAKALGVANFLKNHLS